MFQQNTCTSANSIAEGLLFKPKLCIIRLNILYIVFHAVERHYFNDYDMCTLSCDKLQCISIDQVGKWSLRGGGCQFIEFLFKVLGNITTVTKSRRNLDQMGALFPKILTVFLVAMMFFPNFFQCNFCIVTSFADWYIDQSLMLSQQQQGDWCTMADI